MRLLIYITLIAMHLASALTVYGQEDPSNIQEKVERLKTKKENQIAEEKKQLLEAVEKINKDLENKVINEKEAERLKKQAAEKHAANIQNHTEIIDNQIALIERQELEEDDSTRPHFEISYDSENEGQSLYIGFKKSGDKEKPKQIPYDRRTTSDLFLAFGFNNVLTEGESFNDSEFKVGGSRFFEIGYMWKTRVFQDHNWVRVRYGISFQFNGLKPKNNQYFVSENDQSFLATHPQSLSKSKFRMDNLVLPLFFEFGPSSKVENEEYFRYKTDKKFKFGIGGYTGLNLGTRQKLKYKEDGRRRKIKDKSGLNSNNLVYGLGAYVGYGHTSLYMKYDLNPIFKNNEVDQRNISIGIRIN